MPIRRRYDGPRRGDDLAASFERAVDAALEHGIDLAIHAGDLFNTPRPSSPALAAAAGPLLRLAVVGVPVVIVPGNHERSTIPTNLLLSHRNIHIVSEPCTLSFTVRGARVAVSGFPCIRRQAAARFVSALAATGWSKSRADLRILVTHQTFESATCGPGSHRFRSGDDVVERSAVPAAFDYVAAGHVHRHQALSKPDLNRPPIVYCGSPDRISFAEVNEPKGFVLVEDNGSGLVHNFIEHDVRPVSIRPMNVSGLSRHQILEQIEAIVTGLAPRAVAQLRLSGRSTRSAMSGLRIALRARDLRPDIMLSLTARDVEFVLERDMNARPRLLESAFAHLSAPTEETVECGTEAIPALPTSGGVYAMHDAAGRLLYVGKAKNVRRRVRSHLHRNTGTNFFRGWTRQITRIEARPADSELEALLIEAELIRTLRPPFNRQMRRWKGYCYLVESGRRYGQLDISQRPVERGRCFGPFRGRRAAESIRDAVAEHFGLAWCPEEAARPVTRALFPDWCAARQCERYYAGLCSGPCAGRRQDGDYERRLHRRDALLTGEDDATLRVLERRLERASETSGENRETEHLLRQARVLRAAFDHCAVLRDAERLMHAVLLLPGWQGRRKAAMPTPEGVRIETLTNDLQDAERILRLNRAVSGHRPPGIHRDLWCGRLPSMVMDSLCIAARQLGSVSGQYRFISAVNTAQMNEETLLAVAFAAT